MTALGQAFFLLCSCSFQPGEPISAQTATPQYHSYLHLGSWLQRSVLKAPAGAQPSARVPLHSPAAHKAHTGLKPSLLTQLPSGMPQKKEFQPNWDFLPLPAFRALPGKGLPPRPAGFSLSAPTLPHCTATTEMFHRDTTRPGAVPKH